ncbi:MAG: hypothetical protein JJ871_16850 [Thalassospira sp.]|uniref:hypothetical protein n=1 Tax=Thalassospira sp. TaxID=1912094 RepID=UPI001AFF51A2|nr:hypothetical protein [Thalassospira sp.]MBO6579300.1 hypothetical protein [Thalassospira sp.]MBO6819257.1 hypothetical protein [Thalassospira sp.]MBO6889712.1 hypothetical protein [Thalassospira sp.]
MQNEPYLKDGRLADVIAAITALGNFRYYKLPLSSAAERIANSPDQVSKWEKVFREHPEFFRISGDIAKVCLVWRRQYPKLYDTNTANEITRAAYDDLDIEGRKAISRKPLNASEITALINIATDLHAHSLERAKARKWWIPIATASLGFLGALVGALIGS